MWKAVENGGLVLENLPNHAPQRIVVVLWCVPLVPLAHVVDMQAVLSLRTEEKGQGVVGRDIRISESVLRLDGGGGGWIEPSAPDRKHGLGQADGRFHKEESRLTPAIPKASHRV